MGMDDVGQKITDFGKVISTVIIVVVFVLISIFLMDVAYPVSNQNSSFTGNVESFNIAMPNPYMSFKAESIGLSADVVVFRSVKNVLIDYNNGTETRVGYLPAIQVEYDRTARQPISDVEMSLLFNDVVIDKFSNHADIYGKLTSIDRIKSNDEKVRIYKDGVNRVLINGTNVTDFEQIFFEMVDESKVQIISGDVFISVTDISGLDVEKVKFSKMTIRNGEGEFGLDGHDFDIKTIDNLNIEMLPKSDSFVTIDNDYVHFDGNATSAKLNNDNILINDYSYVLKFKPEKLNAYATLCLVFITILYVIHTRSMVKQTEKSLKQTDNIINQSKKERRMAFIEKRLENFYYPLRNFLLTTVNDSACNGGGESRNLTFTRNFPTGVSESNDLYYNDLYYKEFINHQYLARRTTEIELTYFLNNILQDWLELDENKLKHYDELVKLIDDDIEDLKKKHSDLLNN